MKLRTLGLLPVLAFLAGCPPTLDTSDDTGTDTTTDTGTETDTETDTGTASDTATDPPPAPCSGPTTTLPVTLPYHAEGTSFADDFGAANDIWQTGAACPTAAAPKGPEAVYEIELKAGDTLHATETGSVDVTMYLIDGCNPGDTCLASVDGGSQEILERSVSKDGYYLFVVEAASANPTGSYNLSFGISAAEVCDDGVDNDLDGKVDCDDFGDCFDTPECPFACPATVPVSLPYHSEGSNASSDLGVNFSWSGGAGCGGGSGPEDIVELSLHAGDVIRVSQTGAMDGVVRVVDGCDAGVSACLGSNDYDETVDVVIPADGTYYAIVEAFYGSETDAFSYDISIVEPEDCGDGVDNDVDGLIDCDDVGDCFDTPQCPYTCPVTAPSALPVRLSGSDFTADFTSNAPYELGSNCGSASGSEAVFELDLRAGDRVVVQENGGLNAVVRLLNSCSPGAACIMSVDTDDAFEKVVPVAGTYYAVVEASYSSPYSTDYDILVGVKKNEVCDDGVDNDLDGDVDCSDTDCFGDPAGCSVETFCADGWDNDSDGTLDCDDTDCAGTLVCVPTSGPIVLNEAFDTGIPGTWTVVDGGTETVVDTWTWCDGTGSCGSDYGFTGAAGGFVYANSDAGGSGSTQDEQLVSPVFDLSGATEALLQVDAWFKPYGTSEPIVEASVDAGANWTRVATLPDGVSAPVSISLDAYAGQASVQVRFHFLATYDYHWSLDNVVVRKR